VSRAVNFAHHERCGGAATRYAAMLHILIFDRTNIAKYAFERITGVYVSNLYYDNQI